MITGLLGFLLRTLLGGHGRPTKTTDARGRYCPPTRYHADRKRARMACAKITTYRT